MAQSTVYVVSTPNHYPGSLLTGKANPVQLVQYQQTTKAHASQVNSDSTMSLPANSY